MNVEAFISSCIHEHNQNLFHAVACADNFSRKMKVLVVSDYRGTVSVRPEAEMFIGLARQGIQVDIVTYPGTAYESAFLAAGINVFPEHPTSKFDRKETRKLRRILEEGGYHVMHLYNSRATIHGLKAAKGLPVKVILYRGYAGNVHWYDPLAYMKYLHPRVDAIICITREIQQSIQRQFWFRTDKSVLITKGHDPAWYSAVKPASLASYGIPEGAFTVISVANNRPFKDIPTLLKAAIRISESRDIYWLLVGSGMDTAENLKIIAGSPARDRIVFAGFQVDPLPMMAACQVIANTSIGGEGLNKTLIEGMSLGLAPVVTDIAGNREIVPSSDQGEIVPPGDVDQVVEAIRKYAKDRGYLELKARAARGYIRKALHLDVSIKQTMALYRELVGWTD